jgi:hypothetical protein
MERRAVLHLLLAASRALLYYWYRMWKKGTKENFERRSGTWSSRIDLHLLLRIRNSEAPDGKIPWGGHFEMHNLELLMCAHGTSTRSMFFTRSLIKLEKSIGEITAASKTCRCYSVVG